MTKHSVAALACRFGRATEFDWKKCDLAICLTFGLEPVQDFWLGTKISALFAIFDAVENS